MIVSLGAFRARREQAVLDLGGEWARDVRVRLGEDLTAMLAGDWDEALQVAGLLVPQAPTDEIPDFLAWVVGLSPGELYERVAPLVTRATLAVLTDLGTVRDRAVAVLTAWYEGYFSGVDPAVMTGLAANADAMRDKVARMEPVEAVEVATNGVVFRIQPAPRTVVLVPQYHFNPWNLFRETPDTITIYYPAEIEVGDVPRRLLRLAQAVADQNRLAMLRALGERPRTLTELASLTGLSKATVHHHTVILRAAGLIRTEQTRRLAKRPRGPFHLRVEAVEDVPRLLQAYLTGRGGPEEER